MLTVLRIGPSITEPTYRTSCHTAILHIYDGLVLGGECGLSTAHYICKFLRYDGTSVRDISRFCFPCKTLQYDGAGR